jgi:hypothetical protein
MAKVMTIWFAIPSGIETARSHAALELLLAHSPCSTGPDHPHCVDDPPRARFWLARPGDGLGVLSLMAEAQLLPPLPGRWDGLQRSDKVGRGCHDPLLRVERNLDIESLAPL